MCGVCWPQEALALSPSAALRRVLSKGELPGCLSQAGAWERAKFVDLDSLSNFSIFNTMPVPKRVRLLDRQASAAGQIFAPCKICIHAVLGVRAAGRRAYTDVFTASCRASDRTLRYRELSFAGAMARPSCSSW